MYKLNFLIVLAIALLVASFISASAGGGGYVDKYLKEYKKMSCPKAKAGTADHDVGEKLVRSKCKKEDHKNAMCVATCYYRLMGALDDEHQLETNKKRLAAKMVKTGIYKEKLANFLADAFVNSGCEKKLPPKGSKNCEDAKKGMMCLSVASNKACGATFTDKYTK